MQTRDVLYVPAVSGGGWLVIGRYRSQAPPLTVVCTTSSIHNRLITTKNNIISIGAYLMRAVVAYWKRFDHLPAKHLCTVTRVTASLSARQSCQPWWHNYGHVYGGKWWGCDGSCLPLGWFKAKITLTMESWDNVTFILALFLSKTLHFCTS